MRNNIIHIVSASGAGSSTLGQALEHGCGYKWLDVDGYFWKQTDPPFVESLPHEERVKLLSAAIEEHPKCVVTGSLCGWGDVFIPRFDLVIYVDTPKDIRIERLQKREYERFGERVRNGGDMYENHINFIEWAKSYDTAGVDQRSRVMHEEWFKLLKCPLLRVDGTRPVDILTEEILESYAMEDSFDIILPLFGICRSSSITPIYGRSWSVGDNYVLKSSDSQDELDKSIRLSRLLLPEGVPVMEYIDTTEGNPYAFVNGKYWCLMKRINGTVFEPYIGDPRHNGLILGRVVARLHRAFKRIERRADVRDADFHREFVSWILPELEKGAVTFTDGVIDSLQAFLEREYTSLPRQLIHRDIHTSNLLFEKGALSGYIDFDMCQRNVRVFDIVYLGCSQLVENYRDDVRLAAWHEVFSGILQGYTESVPLDRNELKSMPTLFLFDQVLFTAFYAKIGQPETVKSCIEMTNWMYENIASIIG